MWNDVVDLRDFYQSPLGQAARRLIRRRLRMMWPDVQRQRVLGLGFATPYLRGIGDGAERLLAVMPASQGVVPWPPDGRGQVALAEETALPLPDRSIDRVLLIHCLESTENVRGLMREVWRVLADGGRILVVAPNRSSLWARLDNTPFGQGRPYTNTQLGRLLRDTLFVPLQSNAALFLPPVTSRVVLRSAQAWERVGESWFPTFAGVLLMEATKQIYAGSMPRQAVKREGTYIPLPGA